MELTGVSRVVDRSITPSALLLASSGIGSARLQLIPFPHQYDLRMYGNEVMDFTVSGLRSM